MTPNMKSLAHIFLLFPALGLASDLACRPEGPVVPRPTDLSSSQRFTEAADNLTELLDRAVEGEIKAGWAVENTSFSLALVSTDQKHPGKPVWEYHHLASANVNGTDKLDRDSQYLIGSVTKAFSALALLKSGLSLDAPITDILPQLKSDKSPVLWESVSLRSLANSLSGIAANYGFSEYYFLGEVFQALGFPATSESEYPPCGVTGLNEACTSQQIIEGLAKAYPISAVNERPAYSNIAFTLFTLAIQEATGKNYSSQINDYISKPLGLKNTFPSPGDSSKAVIPPVESTWGSDYGLGAPGGGLVSTLSDLSTFTHGILSRQILSPAETRGWLKPDSLTGSTSSLVGLPWEIYRPAGLLPDYPDYATTIYAKSGGAYGYRSQIALLDSHGAALVLLTAGDMSALPRIYDAMLSTFVPALDAVAREQTAASLEATFASPACSSPPPSNSTANNNTTTEESCIQVTLSLNSTIELTSLTRNNQDILAALTILWDNTIGSQITPVQLSYRIFPTEDVQTSTLPSSSSSSSSSGGKKKKVTRESWRFWLTPFEGDHSASDLPGQGITEGDCFSWSLNDWLHYGGEPVDRVVVVRDEKSGEVVGVDIPFLRSGVLYRV